MKILDIENHQKKRPFSREEAFFHSLRWLSKPLFKLPFQVLGLPPWKSNRDWLRKKYNDPKSDKYLIKLIFKQHYLLGFFFWIKFHFDWPNGFPIISQFLVSVYFFSPSAFRFQNTAYLRLRTLSVYLPWHEKYKKDVMAV